MFHFTSLLVLFTYGLGSASGAGSSGFTYDPNCQAKYKDISANHTMCLVDVPGAEDVPVTQADKDAIVNKHNEFRSEVSPSATNLVKLVWDDNIAVVAAKASRQCVMRHEKHIDRAVPELPGVGIGQNAAYGYASILAAVIDWHSEVSNFKFGEGAINSSKAIGHYTQVVNYRVYRIGCGMAKCSGGNVYQYCNYAAGQYSSELKIPYESGAAASKCPADKRENNLCNCGGIICLNGGTFDITSCSCNCPTRYTGSQCETDKCPGVTCLHGGTVDLSTCTCKCPSRYSGDKCEIEGACPSEEASKCSVYLDRFCFDASYKSACPYTCGDCPKPAACANLVCKNRSVFTTASNTCGCKCYNGYFSGPDCSVLTCPATMPSWCNNYSLNDCTTYWNVPLDCPERCTPEKCNK